MKHSYPGKFIVFEGLDGIECIRNKKLLSSEVVHQKIWKLIKKIL